MIIYEGPSLLDGAPIAVIVTGYVRASKNSKTKNVLQTWIMRADVDPRDAVRSGADYAICGSCVHRSTVPGTMKGRSCYVNVGQAPLSVFRAYKRGKYPSLESDAYAGVHRPHDAALPPKERRQKQRLLRKYASIEALGSGRKVRLGSYGDPAAAPRSVWLSLTRGASGAMGYTHQWRQGFALADLCMASCDGPGDAEAAEAFGYRVFSVTAEAEPRAPGFLVCPASAEAGHKLSCDKCGACGGTSSKARAHVQIAAHGPAARLVQLRRAA
jgi:hypothetical protein